MLEKLYRDLNISMLKADIKTLDLLLADSFTLTHITGYIQSKQEWLKAIASREMSYSKIQIIDIFSQTNNMQGIIIGKALTTANIWGAKGTWRLQLHITLQKEKDWKMQKAIASLF